jgi:small GTP-binding protein
MSKNSSSKNNTYKICFVGASSIGKTCLILRFTKDIYEEDDDPTLEDSHKKSMIVDGEQVELDILDTGGAEEYAYHYKEWFSWADGFVLVYNCHSAYTFDMIPRYREEMIKIRGTKEFPVLLVATQTETPEETWEITTKEGRSVAYTYRCPFLEASAKAGKGVNAIFEEIIREIKDKRKAQAIEDLSSPKKKKSPGGSKAQRPAVVLEDPKKTGTILMKASAKPFKSWKKVWITLKDGVLYIYKKEKDYLESVPTTAVSLLTCTVKMTPGQKKLKNFFELISLQVQYQFQAETQPEMMDWITALQDGIAYMLNENTADKSKLKTGEPRGNLQTWEELKRIPENCICADCGAPDPDWISINLGLLMCIQCSGVHRSMGVHVSKVRSITLDELEKEVQDLMKAVGNKTVNSIWERGLSQSAKKKPDPRDDRTTKEKFIRAKYVSREFVVKEQGISPNQLGKRLHSAVSKNDLTEVLETLSQDVDVNWKDEENGGHTALHIAAAAGHQLAIQMLILNGAEMNGVDRQGQTPLQCAQDASCIELLKKNGAKEIGGEQASSSSSSFSASRSSPRGSSSSSSSPLRKSQSSVSTSQQVSHPTTSSSSSTTGPSMSSPITNMPATSPRASGSNSSSPSGSSVGSSSVAPKSPRKGPAVPGSVSISGPPASSPAPPVSGLSRAHVTSLSSGSLLTQAEQKRQLDAGRGQGLSKAGSGVVPVRQPPTTATPGIGKLVQRFNNT